MKDLLIDSILAYMLISDFKINGHNCKNIGIIVFDLQMHIFLKGQFFNSPCFSNNVDCEGNLRILRAYYILHKPYNGRNTM
jgi:hypothetical protein